MRPSAAGSDRSSAGGDGDLSAGSVLCFCSLRFPVLGVQQPPGSRQVPASTPAPSEKVTAKALPRAGVSHPRCIFQPFWQGEILSKREKSSLATLDESQMPPGAPKIGVPSPVRSRGHPFGVDAGVAGRREGEARKRGSCAAFSPPRSRWPSGTRWEPLRRRSRLREGIAAVPLGTSAATNSGGRGDRLPGGAGSRTDGRLDVRRAGQGRVKGTKKPPGGEASRLPASLSRGAFGFGGVRRGVRLVYPLPGGGGSGAGTGRACCRLARRWQELAPPAGARPRGARFSFL